MIAAVIQMNCEPGNIRKNVAAARDFIRKAADKGAEWAVLPELFQTGYLLGGRDREYAGPVPGGEALCWMEETARELGCSQSSVSERLSNGLKRLAVHLKQ